MSNTLLLTAETNVSTPFLLDYSFAIVCAVLGCALAYFISSLHKLDDAMLHVTKRIGALSTPEEERKFSEYISYIKQWMPAGDSFFQRPAFWYGLDTIGGAIIGASFGLYWSINSTVLWWGSIQFTIAATYFVFFCAIVSYIGGAIIFAAMGSIKAVRRYCKEFVTHERLLALNPDMVGGLRPLGQFSLDLDISFALASFVIFSYLVQGVSIYHPIVAMTLVLYTILLVVVFFVPLSAAHSAMLQTKELAYDQINDVFKGVNSEIFSEKEKVDFKGIKTLRDVYFLYDKVSKMAVWPLNIGIVLKFVAVSSFPTIGSVVVAYFYHLFGL